MGGRMRRMERGGDINTVRAHHILVLRCLYEAHQYVQ